MIISVEEGKNFAESFVSILCASAHKNNHAETMRGFFADTMNWSLACGSKGKDDSPDVLLKDIKEGFCLISSYATHTKPFVVVDTNKGEIIVTYQLVANFNGRIEGVTNIAINPHTYILKVNADKKVVEWTGIWDENHKESVEAVVKLGEMGVDLPEREEPPMLIAKAQGEAFAAKYLKAVSDGFVNNSHSVLFRDLIADNVSWEWSDGLKGCGTREELTSVLATTWGPMLSSFIILDPIVTVDTINGIVSTTYNAVLNVTGGFKDENNAVSLPQVVILHLNENGKADKKRVFWDNNDHAFQAAISKIKAKLEVKSINATKVLAPESPAEELITGQ